MKRLLGFILLLLFVAGCANDHPLVGRWKTIDADGHESVLFFRVDGKFDAITGGEKLPGTWSLNEEVNPAQLQLIFEEQKIVRTLIKISGDQLLVEHAEEGQDYPKEFTDDATKYRRQ